MGERISAARVDVNWQQWKFNTIITKHILYICLPKTTYLFITHKCSTVKYAIHIQTRNSSGDEIANVNFLYHDIVHALQNTIDSCINSVTDRRRYVLERRFTKFSEITQCNGHYAVQGHSRSLILILIESSYTTCY